MNAVGQSNFLQALGWAVINSLWQLALLWIVYQLITAVFKTMGPSRRSALATALLVTGFGWFAYTFFSIYTSEITSDAIVSSGLITLNGNQQLDNWLYRTLPVASVIYLVLLIFPLLYFMRNYRYVQVIRTRGLSKAAVQSRMFVRRVAAQMGIRKPVHIWVSELVTSPVTIGFLKPVVLVPLAAINHLTPQQLEAILLHELAHIRRSDYFINLVIKFIQSVLYFNPFVNAFVKIIECEREKSCDEMVIQYQYDPHGYAAALLVLEKANHLPQSFAVAAAGKRNDLLHRIEWIMGVQKKPVVSFNRLAGFFAGLLCVIVLNAIVILSKPSVASEKSKSSSLASLAAPLYFFAEQQERIDAREQRNNPEEISNGQEIASAIENALTDKEKQYTEEAIVHKRKNRISPEEKLHSIAAHPFVMAVAKMEMPELPVLKAHELAQVKEAINASRKVLQEGQWKEVEKAVAEVFTQQQKDMLRKEYHKQVNKAVNWKNLEARLTMAYDNINWDRVNDELNRAVDHIRFDSLRHVYNTALSQLSLVQTQLTLDSLTAIPDSDITLEAITQKKEEVEKAIDKLKEIKVKKVVRL